MNRRGRRGRPCFFEDRGPLRPLRFFALVAAALLAAAPARAGVEITAEALREDVDLGSGWRYRPGDDPSWADPALDDSSWEEVPDTRLRREAAPASGWPGIGWFRLRLLVAPDAAGAPAALELYGTGAVEV